MLFVTRLLRRLRFRKTINSDESGNVVESIVKARALYKTLSLKAHPDRNPENRELAGSFMAQITANKHNYNELQKIQREIEEKL